VLPDGKDHDNENENDNHNDVEIKIHEPLPLTLMETGIIEPATHQQISQLSASSTSPSINLMICINMIHISPWSATLGLFALANQLLPSNGILVTYGPYKENGTAVESNLNFDRSLKSRNPEWGVRDLEQVVQVAEERGMRLEKKMDMPANNLLLIFVKK
jgi:hypothetical protein